MTTVQDTMTTADAVRASVATLGPEIAARASATEAARRVPPDLLDQLKRIGCFRVLLPPSHGGLGADLPAALRVFEECSRRDGSAGWTVAIGASGWRDVAALPRATFDALYAEGPDTIVVGVFNPAGTLRDDPGGYRVRGRWPFASGCEHADWVYGNGIHEGAPAPGLRMSVFAPDEIVIEDTWRSLGLRGTGSHHFRVEDLVLPVERTCATLESEPCVDVPLLRIPPPSQFALSVASVALGVAAGALDDVQAVAAQKVPFLAHSTLATDRRYHQQLAVAEAGLAAARVLLHAEAEHSWADAVDGVPAADERRARVRAAAAWATAQAASVVTGLHHIAGSAGVYEDGPLPRRLRDIHTITQHFLVRPSTFDTSGALLAGQPIDVPIF